MKILIVADEESKALWDFYTPDKLEGIDLIISCGDLKAEYLEFLATMVSIPILYVPGNHNSRYVKHPPEGCECIDGDIYVYKGVRILGLGGSMKYKNGPYMYTEAEMRHNINKVKTKIFMHSGFDILVTHSPAKGYGDLEDLPHQGYECFNTLLNKCKPLYMFHGHVHTNYGWNIKRVSKHPSGTTIINGFERYVLDYDTDKKSDFRRWDLFFGKN